MAGKFAYLISACVKYLPEVTALLNSLERIGNRHDVFLNGYKLPDEFIAQFPKLGYKVNYYAIPEEEARQFGGESEILCRKRYWYAAEYGKDYDALALLDADMLFVRPVDNFFEIAAKCGFILGATLEQKTVYGTDKDGHDHQRVNGEHLVKVETWNPKDICCTPMFIDAKKYGAQLRKSWEIFATGGFKAPDQQSLNCILVAEGLTDNVVLLPNVCWVSSNEKLLKFYQHVTTQKDGLLWTEAGEPVFIVHGRYYTRKWRKQQLINRHHCAEGYIKATECSDAVAEGSMNCLYGFFRDKLDNGPLKADTTKEYTIDGHPDWTYEEKDMRIV